MGGVEHLSICVAACFAWCGFESGDFERILSGML